MKLWIKLQHWFYRILIDYKTKKIIEFGKELEKYKKQVIMKFWIVRDLSEELILYKEQPSYNNIIKMWVDGGLPVGKLRGFPEVTFENSPQLVEIKLVKEE